MPSHFDGRAPRIYFDFAAPHAAVFIKFRVCLSKLLIISRRSVAAAPPARHTARRHRARTPGGAKHADCFAAVTADSAGLL